MSGVYSNCGLLGINPKEVPCENVRHVDDLDSLDLKSECGFLGLVPTTADISNISDECNVLCTRENGDPGIVRGGKCIVVEDANIGRTTSDLLAAQEIVSGAENIGSGNSCTLNITYKKDGNCESVTRCVTGEYEFQAPSLSSDRICKDVSAPCRTDEYEKKAPTSTSDRQCSAISAPCDGVNTYESEEPVPGRTDRVCSPVTQCTSDQLEIASATSTTDTQCQDIRRCNADEYESVAPVKNNGKVVSDRVCAALTICNDIQQSDNPTEYEEIAPFRNASLNMYTSDRVCGDLTTCKDLRSHPTNPEEYEKVAPTLTTDRECAELSICNNLTDSATEYESSPPEYNKDRECSDLTVCNKSIQYTANPIHYESKDRTPTSDRVCTNLTVCEFPYKFQADLPTHTTDRVCQDVTDCEADKDPECYYETDQEPSKTFVVKPYDENGPRAEMYMSDRTCKRKSPLFDYERNDAGVCVKTCNEPSKYFRGFCRGLEDDCSDYTTRKVYSRNKIEGQAQEPIGNWTILQKCDDNGCEKTWESTDPDERKLSCEFMGVNDIEALKRKTREETIDLADASYADNIRVSVGDLVRAYEDNKAKLLNEGADIVPYNIAEPGNECKPLNENQCEVYAKLHNLQYIGEVNEGDMNKNENGCIIRSMGYRKPPYVEFLGVNGRAFEPTDTVQGVNLSTIGFETDKCATQANLSCVCRL